MKIKPITSTPVEVNSISNNQNTQKISEAKIDASRNQDAASVNVSSNLANNSEKVSKIKEQIQAGTYKPISEDVAKAIARDLL
jgi:anti-sigma28 factor (negative regulator of flagellin synthesis)